MVTNVIRKPLAVSAILAAGALSVVKPPVAGAMTLPAVIATVRDSGGHYAAGGASLQAADCSGLVSVLQSLAMGQAPHRLGNTHTLLAGRWPNAIAGASPDDLFIIGVSPSHMVARIGGVNGVNIEARTSGMPFLIGDAAASPWDRQFSARFHVDPAVLVL